MQMFSVSRLIKDESFQEFLTHVHHVECLGCFKLLCSYASPQLWGSMKPSLYDRSEQDVDIQTFLCTVFAFRRFPELIDFSALHLHSLRDSLLHFPLGLSFFFSPLLSVSSCCGNTLRPWQSCGNV